MRRNDCENRKAVFLAITDGDCCYELGNQRSPTGAVAEICLPTRIKALRPHRRFDVRLWLMASIVLMTSAAAQSPCCQTPSVIGSVASMADGSLGEEPSVSQLSDNAQSEFVTHDNHKSPRCGLEGIVQEVSHDERLPPGFVEGLIAWIAAKASWIYGDSPPICFVPQSSLVRLYYGPFAAQSAETMGIQIAALYSRRTGIVYLPDAWNVRNLHDRAALLHELVHHLQAANNVEERCLAAYERQAHHLTIDWLGQEGVQKPYEFLNIDEFTIRLISQCPE